MCGFNKVLICMKTLGNAQTGTVAVAYGPYESFSLQSLSQLELVAYGR